jgi:type I restriction enzyme, S subunit
MKNWDIFNLGDIATFINGYAFKPSDWKESGLEIIRIQNLTKGAAQINYFQGSIPEKYKVTKGDILISWSGSLGVYEWQKEDAWLNQHLFKVVFDKEDVDKTFFKYLISQALDKLETQVHGATMKHITKKNFDAFQIPLPPLEQQKRIAAILDAADTYRQKTKALIAKYDELTQSLFLDMFGDVMKNPKQFPIKLLEELCEEIIDCPHSTPNYVEYNTEFPCIRTTELDNGAINWSKMKYLNYEGYIKRTKRLVPKEGDIIYGREGSFGEAAIVPVGCKMSLGQRVMLFRPNSNLINSKFLHAVVRSNGVYKQALRVTSGSTVGHINVKDIKKFKLIVAPLGLQNQFAERVQAIEEQKAKAQASLEKAEELFASLLQKSLKGELV